MIGEVTGDETVTYVRGVNLIFGRTQYYLYHAHGDVVQLTNTNGELTRNYNYDAFGNERDPDEDDINPFRYCGEYYDTETGLYYLRARYYDPLIGRFTQEDTHWNTANMIYGDNPQKINEREDKLGLKHYSYAPQLSAVVQSGNLYVYTANNPVLYSDLSGQSLVFAGFDPLISLVKGFLAQAFMSVISYAEIAFLSVSDDIIASDMNAIGWDPFNEDESAVGSSQKVSFYRGVPVVRTDMDRPFSFLIIFLNQGPNEVKHEYGHNIQQLFLGPIKYGTLIGLPSALNWSKRDYYNRPWEITADLFGEAVRVHTQEDISRGLRYLVMADLYGPVAYLFILGEYTAEP